MLGRASALFHRDLGLDAASVIWFGSPYQKGIAKDYVAAGVEMGIQVTKECEIPISAFDGASPDREARYAIRACLTSIRSSAVFSRNIYLASMDKETVGVLELAQELGMLRGDNGWIWTIPEVMAFSAELTFFEGVFVVQALALGDPWEPMVANWNGDTQHLKEHLRAPSVCVDESHPDLGQSAQCDQLPFWSEGHAELSSCRTYAPYAYDAAVAYAIALDHAIQTGAITRDMSVDGPRNRTWNVDGGKMQQALGAMVGDTAATRYYGNCFGKGPLRFNANQERDATYEVLNFNTHCTGELSPCRIGEAEVSYDRMVWYEQERDFIKWGQGPWLPWNNRPNGWPPGCPEGEFLADGTSGAECTKIPLGKFLAEGENGELVLLPCAPGTKGVTGGSCVACDVGEYSNLPEQTECQLCPVGKYSSRPGQTACQECSPGFFQPSRGKRECALCPEGQYSSLPRQARCKTCLPGSTTLVLGAKRQEQCVCAQGTYDSRPQELLSEIILALAAERETGTFSSPLEQWPTPAMQNPICQPCYEGVICDWETEAQALRSLGVTQEGYMVLASAVEAGLRDAWQCANVGSCPAAQISTDQDTCPENSYSYCCAVCETGYFWDLNTCKHCGQQSVWSWVTGTLVFLLFCACVFLYMAGYYEGSDAEVHVRVVGIKFTACVGILFSHVQVFWLVASSSRTIENSELYDFLAGPGKTFFLTGVFNWECAAKDATTSEAALYSVIFANTLPAVAIAVVFLMPKIYNGIVYVFGVQNSYRLHSTYGLSFLLSLFETLFLMIASNAFNALITYNHPAPNDHIVSIKRYPSIRSVDSEMDAMRIIAWVCVIVWCLGYLVVCVFLFLIFPLTVKNSQFLAKLLIPYFARFEDDRFWFCIIIVVRRFVLVLCGVFWKEETQLLLMSLILMCALMTNEYFRPYRFRIVKLCDDVSLYTQMTTILILLSILPGTPPGGVTSLSVIIVGSTLILVGGALLALKEFRGAMIEGKNVLVARLAKPNEDEPESTVAVRTRESQIERMRQRIIPGRGECIQDLVIPATALVRSIGVETKETQQIFEGMSDQNITNFRKILREMQKHKKALEPADPAMKHEVIKTIESSMKETGSRTLGIPPEQSQKTPQRSMSKISMGTTWGYTLKLAPLDAAYSGGNKSRPVLSRGERSDKIPQSSSSFSGVSPGQEAGPLRSSSNGTAAHASAASAGISSFAGHGAASVVHRNKPVAKFDYRSGEVLTPEEKRRKEEEKFKNSAKIGILQQQFSSQKTSKQGSLNTSRNQGSVNEQTSTETLQPTSLNSDSGPSLPGSVHVDGTAGAAQSAQSSRLGAYSSKG